MKVGRTRCGHDIPTILQYRQCEFDVKYGDDYGMNDATIEYKRSIDKSINYSKPNILLQEFK